MNTDSPKPSHAPLYIKQAHWQEWTQESGIDPELTAMAIRSLDGDEPYSRLIYSHLIDRRNDGRITNYWLNKYNHTRKGGWWGSGIDPLTGEKSEWGCFKPDHPRMSEAKGFDHNPKPIKYEHPPKVPTEAFFLNVPQHIWEQISERYDVPIGNYTNFWTWVADHPQLPISLTEGLKKAAALITAGYIAIAIPGIWNGIKHKKDEFGNNIGKPYLIPQLQMFCQKDRQIFIVLDQDVRQSTRQSVNKAIATTARLLEAHKCKAMVVSWNPKMGKGIDDLWVNHCIEAIEKAYNNSLLIEQWRASLIKQLTYPINLELNCRYLTGFAPPPDSNLIVIKSPKNTYKTGWLSEQIEPLIRKGVKVLVITHRVQLGEELCNRFGIHYITEVRGEATGGLWGYGLCVDSLHPKSQAKFNPADWEGAWIIMDECQQVLWHLLNSSTCQQDRAEILRCFKEVIQIALSTGGKVFLSDADLRDSSIDYIKSLSNVDVNPWICVNNWKHEGWKVTNFNQKTPAKFVAQLIKHIEQTNEPTWISVSGQHKKSKWGTQILEAMLRERFPNIRILRIDSHSIADPHHPAFGCIANDLNKILPRYDIVIASPSVETGVSITCNHFTSVWGIFQGVQTTDAARQALSRVRDNVPRFIWAANISTASRAGNGSTSIKSLLKSQRRLLKENLSLLPDDEIDFDGFNLDLHTESLRTWAIEAAIVNQGMANYRSTILDDLAKEGHTIKFDDDADDDDAKLIKDKAKQTSEAECSAHYIEVAKAQSLSDDEYKLLKEQRAKTTDERYQFEKGALERRYLVPITPELARKDTEKWHPKIRLEYFLSQGRKYLSSRDVNVAQKQIEAGNGVVFTPDFNRSQLGGKIYLLDALGITKLFTQPERELRNSDSDLQKIASKAKANWQEIKDHLGIGISHKDTPITIIKRLVKAVGWDIHFLRKDGARGQQQRVYSLSRPSDGRDEVFAAWLDRDELRESNSVATRCNRSISDQLRDYGYQILEALDSGAQQVRDVVEMAGREALKAFYQLFPHRLGDLMDCLGVG